MEGDSGNNNNGGGFGDSGGVSINGSDDSNYDNGENMVDCYDDKDFGSGMSLFMVS